MDVVLAMVAYLKAQGDVVAELGDDSRIYDFEIPPELDIVQPQKGILIRPHGGPRDLGPLQLNYSRFQLVCYGETPHLSYVVYRTAYLAFKRIVATPSVWAATYIHNVIEESGPVFGRDVTLQWPYHIALYQAKASDLTIS